MKLTREMITSRRTLLVGAGVAAIAASSGALMRGGSKAGVSTPVGDIDPNHITALGDGFYLADGWVLSEVDLKHAGVAAPASE